MFDTTFSNYFILPLLIFIARVGDMSLDTLRIMLLSRGRRYLPPLIGFFQVLVWLLVMRQIFLHLSNAVCFVAYAGGFAVGTYVGMVIEERLAIGFQVIRVITRMDASALIRRLKDDGYGVTSLDAQGTTGKVNLIFTIISRKEIPKVIEIIKHYHPKAFYTVEDIRSVNEGVFPFYPANRTPDL